jgi:hypothetical protein
MLPIKDVLALEAATYNSIPVIRTRTDPCEYLEQKGPFVNASDLLRVMSLYGAVLSGSRALDWFVPGSATKTSDWDFYVPNVPSAISAVKGALEKSGVVFQTCLTQQVVLQAIYKIYPKLRVISQSIKADRSFDLNVDVDPIDIKQDGSTSRARSRHIRRSLPKVCFCQACGVF